MRTLLIAAALLGLATPTLAQEVTLASAQPTVNIPGRDRFCLSHSELCSLTTPAEAVASLPLLVMLQEVNDKVNEAIDYQPEPKGENVWQLSPREGDCEDYALTKMAELLSLGVPRGAMSLAAMLTAKKERHMVLLVHTDQGDLVLDNQSRRSQVSRLSDYPGARWIAVEDGAMNFHFVQ